MKKIFYFAMLLAAPAMAQEQTVFSTFEDTGVEFNAQGYWNGGAVGEPVEGDWGELIYRSQFTSGMITGNVDYSIMYYGDFSYDWWGGVALSQRIGTTLYSLDDQYNCLAGVGVNGSETFAVIYGDGATIELQEPAEVRSFYVINSPYTMSTVLEGDGYCPKFENAGDHFYLVVTGTKADGTEMTKTIKLVDYTTELSYVSMWTKISLSEFGNDVTKLTFTFDTHNSGVPLYACIDQFEVVYDATSVGIDGVQNAQNIAAGEVYDLNGRMLKSAKRGINIVRMADGSIRKVLVK